MNDMQEDALANAFNKAQSKITSGNINKYWNQRLSSHSVEVTLMKPLTFLGVELPFIKVPFAKDDYKDIDVRASKAYSAFSRSAGHSFTANKSCFLDQDRVKPKICVDFQPFSS
jgi:hypothetical protein